MNLSRTNGKSNNQSTNGHTNDSANQSQKPPVPEVSPEQKELLANELQEELNHQMHQSYLQTSNSYSNQKIQSQIAVLKLKYPDTYSFPRVIFESKAYPFSNDDYNKKVSVRIVMHEGGERVTEFCTGMDAMKSSVWIGKDYTAVGNFDVSEREQIIKIIERVERDVISHSLLFTFHVGIEFGDLIGDAECFKDVGNVVTDHLENEINGISDSEAN